MKSWIKSPRYHLIDCYCQFIDDEGIGELTAGAPQWTGRAENLIAWFRDALGFKDEQMEFFTAAGGPKKRFLDWGSEVVSFEMDVMDAGWMVNFKVSQNFSVLPKEKVLMEVALRREEVDHKIKHRHCTGFKIGISEATRRGWGRVPSGWSSSLGFVRMYLADVIFSCVWTHNNLVGKRQQRLAYEVNTFHNGVLDRWPFFSGS